MEKSLPGTGPPACSMLCCQQPCRSSTQQRMTRVAAWQQRRTAASTSSTTQPAQVTGHSTARIVSPSSCCAGTYLTPQLAALYICTHRCISPPCCTHLHSCKHAATWGMYCHMGLYCSLYCLVSLPSSHRSCTGGSIPSHMPRQQPQPAPGRVQVCAAPTTTRAGSTGNGRWLVRQCSGRCRNPAKPSVDASGRPGGPGSTAVAGQYSAPATAVQSACQAHL
jgi:hypothetical protein